MIEEKFTEGPWLTEYKKDISGMYAQKVFDENGEDICSCSWYPVYEGNGVTTTNREANANLIAAAPQMYRMLETLINRYPNSPHIQDPVIKLLAKARGEHEP